MKKKSGSRRRTKIVHRSKKNIRRTVRRKSLAKGRRRPTRRQARVQRGGDTLTDNSNCFVTVGEMYYYGIGNLDRDDEMAVKLYTVAADNGNADAQFKLGKMYNLGEGVKQDYAEAVRLYSLAAAQGHAVAQFKLGKMYENGRGVEPDDEAAIRFYSLAAAQRHTDAIAALKKLVPQSN
jgi:hypothetical protein